MSLEILEIARIVSASIEAQRSGFRESSPNQKQHFSRHWSENIKTFLYKFKKEAVFRLESYLQYHATSDVVLFNEEILDQLLIIHE